MSPLAVEIQTRAGLSVALQGVRTLKPDCEAPSNLEHRTLIHRRMQAVCHLKVSSSGSTAANKVTLSVSSNKRDDHSDQEVKSIPTRSMRLPFIQEQTSGFRQVVRLLIVETVTAQGSAFAS